MPIEPIDDEHNDEFRDTPLPAATRITKSSSGAVTVLGAAMIAVGEILEPEKASVEMEQPADDLDDDSGLDLSFGDLPPIEEL
ncbi:MAG: hypothetical protein AAGC53_02335 [Actinomycetota bacterium]